MTPGPGRSTGPDRPEAGAPPDGAAAKDGAGARPRSTRWLYVRVILVQLATLAALWLLQATFGGG